MKIKNIKNIVLFILLVFIFPITYADESLLGYVKGSETLPEGAWEFQQNITYRDGKGAGDYDAWDFKTEIEYGVTNRLTIAAYLKSQAVNTKGILVNGYIPEDEDTGIALSGVEGTLKYNFLSPAKDDIGLSGYFGFSYDWKDKHSGQGKDKATMEAKLLVQKYFMEGQLVWMGNMGIETTHARRDKINRLPADIDWPSHPEMEIELIGSTGLSYRFVKNWFIGIEAMYETEYETVIGQERWTLFLGPSLHYGGKRWWGTFTWFPQIVGGGEKFDAQNNKNLHLIEKTEQEFRLKFGIDF